MNHLSQAYEFQNPLYFLLLSKHGLVSGFPAHRLQWCGQMILTRYAALRKSILVFTRTCCWPSCGVVVGATVLSTWEGKPGLEALWCSDSHLASLVELILRLVTNRWLFSVWVLEKKLKNTRIVQGFSLIPLTLKFQKHFQNAFGVQSAVEGRGGNWRSSLCLWGATF